ncbi:diguanylate cyclase [Eubacteriaceae bacterium ES2]|nr:diguanylate cyclase [Eubacteriaceae bacterium ES2]
MFKGEAIYTSKWGKAVYLRMQFVPLHDYNGMIAGVQGIVEDFTEYKKAQDQLRTYYYAIEHSQLAGKILDVMEKPLTQKNLKITSSIGVAVYPDHGTNHESLLLSADKAMYQAKNAGKSNYRFYAPEENL